MFTNTNERPEPLSQRNGSLCDWSLDQDYRHNQAVYHSSLALYCPWDSSRLFNMALRDSATWFRPTPSSHESLHPSLYELSGIPGQPVLFCI